MIKILQGDCIDQLRTLPDESVHCCVTSPPYWGLRDYGVGGQIGLEKTPEEYVAKLVAVFKEVRRVLRNDGTVWLNLGDTYFGSGQGYGDTKTTNKNHTGSRERQKPVWSECGLKSKDLVGIPWRVAFALQSDGWYLRQDIIWSKPNTMPESVTDRCTKAHEYVFLLTKSAQYYYDNLAIQEPAQNWGTRDRTNMRNGTSDPKLKHHGLEGSDEELQNRNKRSVWTINTHSCKEAHFATFPPDLIRPMILAGCPVTGTVLDPFGGSGTTGMVAEEEGRNSILIELNPAYVEIAKRRTQQQGLFCIPAV